MSDEKGLLKEEKEEVELMKNEPSSMEEEKMAEEKPAVEKSDRGELMVLITLHCCISHRDASYIVP